MKKQINSTTNSKTKASKLTKYAKLKGFINKNNKKLNNKTGKIIKWIKKKKQWKGKLPQGQYSVLSQYHLLTN